LRAREQDLAALLDGTGDPLLAVDDGGQPPFNEDMISRQGKTDYIDVDFPADRGRFCTLTMSRVDQEVDLIVFERNRSWSMSLALQ